MPRTVKSEQEKTQLLEFLQSATGHQLIHKDHHSDWYVSKDGSVEVYLTYSQGDFWREPFFDMQPDDLKKLANHPAAFILFVLDDHDRYLVIPAKTLWQHLSNTIPNAADGRYLLNIDRKSREFRQIPGWKLKPYLNNTEQIPKTPQLV